MIAVRFAIVLSMITAAPSLAFAQPASREAIDQFVTAFAAPTHMTGKIARWESGICPLTVGQQPEFTKFVTQRVKDVAAQAGAPVNNAASCTPNIDIVFSKIPQELLNNVRAHQPEYLGFAGNSAEMEKLATVTRPVQAWYTTQTEDRQGMRRIDSVPPSGQGVGVAAPGGVPGPTDYLSNATYARVSGNRISDGVKSTFFHIVIVADINKLKGYEAGPMADYIAMLALAQLNSLDTCQPLPSVENMLAKGCEAMTGVLTAADIAYLRGLYQMNPDRMALLSQKSEIADRMSQALGGK
ncbi:MAG TPA: hypothetical protein VN175_12790 [Rhizomicrobium sp.]|jgi:hypothetical protein|nr:hypothetical protein [Rhizomicrobium sp.]